MTRVAYFDCLSGISGDMTLGALIDAGASLEKVNAAVHSLGLEQVQISHQTVKKCGFRALQVRIDHPPEHAHRHLHHIEAMLDKGDLHPRARKLAGEIFRFIGEAEAKVHGVEIKKVHFHEVGAIDSIADIVGVSVAMTELGIDRVDASPVPTGTGFIQIAHGRVSVPAPATAELLAGVPLAECAIEGELTTPTGAGILRATCLHYGPMPSITIDRIGYGAGTKDFPQQANILRIIIGNLVDPPPEFAVDSDRVWTLGTNVDDYSPAELAAVIDLIWKLNPLEVNQSPCVMKKGRLGISLTILCEESQILPIEELLFRSELTIGVRRWPVMRHKLIRRPHTVNTPYGAVLGKCLKMPNDRWRFAPEIDSLKACAAEHSVQAAEVKAAAMAAFTPPQN